MFHSESNLHEIKFGSKSFHRFHASSRASPCFDEISNDMRESKVKDGFSKGNFGSIVEFETSAIQRLLAWNEVLIGRDSGAQVWSNCIQSRDLHPLFSNKRRSSNALMPTLHNFHLGFYGDQPFALELVSLHCKALAKHKSEESSLLRRSILQLEPPILNGDSCNKLLHFIDRIFRKGIERSCASFCELRDSIAPIDERNEMIEKCKTIMPNHCKTIKKMMGIDKKDKLIKNEALRDRFYCDKRLFYSFLSSVRSKNPKNVIWWSMVHAASACASGASRCSQNKIGMTLGTSCAIQTFMDKTRPLANNMDIVIARLLSTHKIAVGAIDNNQKGHSLTFQRCGSGNKFVKVTARCLREPIYFEHDINYIVQPTITCSEQEIPSPCPMPPFELEEEINFIIIKDPMNDAFPTAHEPIDVKGRRVCKHVDCLNNIDFIQLLFKHMSGCNSVSKKFKHCVNMPTKYKTMSRNSFVLKMHGLKRNALDQIQHFQKKVVCGWNPANEN